MKLAWISAIALLWSMGAMAQDCNTQGTQSQRLQLVNPKFSGLKNPIAVQWLLVGKELHVQFNVGIPVLHSKIQLGPKEYPFQFDVTEIFLAVNDPSEKDFSYFEFELTPRNQNYDVKISVKDGKKVFVDGIDFGVQTSAQITKRGWTTTFIIPLDVLGWKGDVRFLRGNFFAIVGKGKQRSFWSTFLPQQAKPNFHATEFFKPLFFCEEKLDL